MGGLIYFLVGFLLGAAVSMGILLAVIFHDELVRWYKRMMKTAHERYLDVHDIIRDRFRVG
jgi:hypothetical protein